MRPIRVSTFDKLVSIYCEKQSVAMLYYEINCPVDKRDDVVAYYTGKIDNLLLAPLKRDDDCYIEFPSDAEAILYAENNFPYESDLVDGGIDPDYFIHCRVWNRFGQFSWENKNGGVIHLPEAQEPA